MPEATNMEPKGCQHEAKGYPNRLENTVWICLCLRQSSNNGHGALAGLTSVKGTRVEKSILLFKKMKTLFLALAGLTLVKGRSARKSVRGK